MHLLIIEDDIDLGTALVTALRQEDISCVWVRRAAQAAQALGPEVDVVVLDLSLPDGEGVNLLRQWRAREVRIPVVIVTARSALEDRLEGLDNGADDYLVKPFAVPELIARIWAVHRRSVSRAADHWTFGELVLSARSRQAWLSGALLSLSKREFELLVELAKRPGQVVSKGVLGQWLEPLGDPVDPATIEVHLSNLRRKIGPHFIRTVRGVGYQWQAPTDAVPVPAPPAQP